MATTRYRVSPQKRTEERGVVEEMTAELYVVGELEKASGFPDSRLFCRWELQFGGGWRLVGRRQGRPGSLPL